jgi:hypothetical protein
MVGSSCIVNKFGFFISNEKTWNQGNVHVSHNVNAQVQDGQSPKGHAARTHIGRPGLPTRQQRPAHNDHSPRSCILFSRLPQAAMDEWIRQAESWIRQQPPEQIYIAAAVVALTILLLIVGTCAAKPRLLLKFPAFLSTEYCAANAHGFLCVGMK